MRAEFESCEFAVSLVPSPDLPSESRKSLGVCLETWCRSDGDLAGLYRRYAIETTVPTLGSGLWDGILLFLVKKPEQLKALGRAILNAISNPPSRARKVEIRIELKGNCVSLKSENCDVRDVEAFCDRVEKLCLSLAKQPTPRGGKKKKGKGS